MAVWGVVQAIGGVLMVALLIAAVVVYPWGKDTYPWGTDDRRKPDP